jgi:hypothetical protein
MRRCLVVANQTLASTPLHEEILKRVRAGPCRFHVVVPATPPSEQATWTEGEAKAIAERRLAGALSRLHALGVIATGEVGDTSPVLAVGDVLLRERFDEVILSTLPSGASRWLHLDLPHRLSQRVGIPVTHVVSEPAGTTNSEVTV